MKDGENRRLVSHVQLYIALPSCNTTANAHVRPLAARMPVQLISTFRAHT